MIDDNMNNILKNFAGAGQAGTDKKMITDAVTGKPKINSARAEKDAMKTLLEGLDAQQKSVNQMPANRKMGKNTKAKHPASNYLVGGEFDDDGQELEEDIDSAYSVAIELKQMYDSNEKNVQEIMKKSADPYNTLMYVLYPNTAKIDGTKEYNAIVDSLGALMTANLEEGDTTISKLRDSYNGWEVREYPTHWIIIKPGKDKNAVHATGTRQYIMRKWKALKKKNTIKESKSEENFTVDDLHQLSTITDLGQLKARAMELIANSNSARPMKPEKVQWFRGQMERKNSVASIIKMMWDLLLAGEGNKVVGSGSSMSKSAYNKTFDEGRDSLVTTWAEVQRNKRNKKLKRKSFEPATTECPDCLGDGGYAGGDCPTCGGAGEIHEGKVREQLSPKQQPKQAMHKKQSFKDIFKSMDENSEDMETRFKRELHDEIKNKELKKGDNGKAELAEDESSDIAEIMYQVKQLKYFAEKTEYVREEFEKNNGETFVAIAKKIIRAVDAIRNGRTQ